MTRRISSAGTDAREEAGAGRTGDTPEAWTSLPTEARARLGKLFEASPLYESVLRQRPDWALWLEEDRNLRADYRYGALTKEWASFAGAAGLLEQADAQLDTLRRWRRLMSLRIAYRTVNGLCTERTAVEELTRLAEFCIRECLTLGEKHCRERLGEPWDDDVDRPARFCVLALGKLGGGELNFSSDVDLLFVHDGEGNCRRDGRPGSVATVEYFTRLAEFLTRALSAQTPDGFLFRVDLRLRPEGNSGPLVRSLTSLEHYYSIAGQTWERLALIKARPIAGELSVGFELLESVQSFRYPRNPPASLAAEVSAMKLRTETEVVGNESLDRDVKSGTGGIREIEFVIQSQQLLFAGRYPFLQTHSTEAALAQLVRYGLMQESRAAFLRTSYWFLRAIEHRLQMREERQTHTLPADPHLLDSLAHSLGLSSRTELEDPLRETRSGVRAIYSEFFPPETGRPTSFEAWWTFFTTQQKTAWVDEKLASWFSDTRAGAEVLQEFACGDRNRLVTREQVRRFDAVTGALDRLAPLLGDPVLTLRRLSRFAERYGSRNQFLGACAENPAFFRALALLFDRSTFVHDLLCAHPEILEEILRPEILPLRKSAQALARELKSGPEAPNAYAAWLPLYLRAEQVRYSAMQLLGMISLQELERSLTALADAAISDVFHRIAPLRNVLVVALGSYGGGELSLGSDLDVVFIAAPEDVPNLDLPLREALRMLGGRDALGSVLELDSRLRPHGDAGPAISTLAEYHSYHEKNAQLWERQLLTRARAVCGPASLRERWEAFVRRVVYERSLEPQETLAIWQMRRRIQSERDVATPPERAFKTGAGGLIDVQFLAQIQQLQNGHAVDALRVPGTREALAAATARGLIAADTSERLLGNYDWLKELECAVRRDQHRAVSVVPADSRQLARWLGYRSPEAFSEELRQRLGSVRTDTLNLLFQGADPL